MNIEKSLALAFLPFILLGGCAPSLSATERGGIISHVGGWNRGEAVALADKHCHQSNRIARITSSDPLNSALIFDCVE